MNTFKRRTLTSIATIFIAAGSMTISTAGADAALFGPSSNYLVKITPATQAAVEKAIKSSGGEIKARFEYAFNGFVIKLPDALIPILKKIPNVLTVEKDMPMDGLGIQQNQTPTPSWGIDRIDQREVVSTTAGYQGTYGYRSAGTGTTIYIGDTGIYPSADLAGRISSVGYSGIADGNGPVDCNGHGTHVATTAAGTQYGIAKNATVVPVRILDCTGRGSYASVIAGLDWILSPLNTNSKTQAVVNLSIGGSASTILNDAILKLTNAGITVVAAAGNDNIDACKASPASAPTAITVGATTIADAKAYFSNWGSCVDINAPGVGITGSWIDSPESTRTISGTSMATPHVAGAAAVFLGLNPGASVAQVTAGLLAQSTLDAVTGNVASTPNRMLYVSPTDGGPAIVVPNAAVKTISRVTHQSADVVVEINPGNAPTTAELQYSTNSAFAAGVTTINLTPTALNGGELVSLPIALESLTASSTYFIRVKATNESGSLTTPAETFKTIAAPVSAPRPVALAPSAFTGYNARLTGTVNAMNGNTNVFFVYGTDPLFATNTLTGASTPATVSGASNTPVALDISFLKGQTTYYYKVVAGNSVASVESNVISFTTPVVEGRLATVETIRPTGGLNTPTTTVTGYVNPQGQTTSVRLVYGVEQTMTVNPKIINLPQQYTGMDTVTVTADMINLVPGYRYYYRFEAQNAAGITKMTPLTNTGNPVMPVVVRTFVNNVTTTTMNLNASVNAGAGNLRIYFVYGTDPNLETGTTTVQATPFALTYSYDYPVSFALKGLAPATAYYFRVKMFAYTGPLADAGGTAYGPIVKAETPFPPREAQTITFNLPTTRFYSDPSTPLSASSSSGLPVTFETYDPKVCKVITVDSQPVLTYSEPISTTAASSTCRVYAYQAGTYTIAPQQSPIRTITFMKDSTVVRPTWSGALTETGTTLDLVVASSSRPTLNESVAGTAPLAVVSKTPTICAVESVTYQGTATSHTRAQVRSLWNGTCHLAATFAGHSYWAATSLTFSTTVSGMKAPLPGANVQQSIGFATPVNTTVGVLVPLVINTNSGLPVTVVSMTPATCSVIQNTNGTFSAQSAAGLTGDNNICTISASQAGDGRWAPAPTQVRSFNWIRKAQTITITAPMSRYYGGAPSVISAVSTSGLPVTLSTSTPLICTLSQVDTQTVLSYVGPITATTSSLCLLVANQAGDSIYSPAPQLTRSVSWIKEATTSKIASTLPVTETGTAVDIRIMSAMQPLLAEVIGGGEALTITSKTLNICQVSDATYVGSATSHTRVTVRGLWNGSCQLGVSFAGFSYWSPSTTTLFMTVSGIKTPQSGANAAQTISFTTPGNAEFGFLNPLSAKATSALPVTLTSMTPLVCSVVTLSNGTTATQSVAGLTGDTNLCTIKAEQAGNASWAAATATTRSFNYMRKNQSLTFNLASSRYIGGAPTQLVATATSGLPVSFTTTTPTTCSISQVDSKTVLSLLAVPSTNSALCSVTAAQAGDGTFRAASSWIRTISWMKEPTAFKWNLSAPLNVTGVKASISVYSAVQSSLAELNGGSTPLTVSSTTPTICTVSNPTYIGTSVAHTEVTVKAIWNGTCRLSVSFAGNTHWLPSSTTFAASVSSVTAPQTGANAAQYITFLTIPNREYGPGLVLTAVSTSRLPITYTSLTPQNCMILALPNNVFAVQSASGASGDGVSCSVQASQPGNSAWAPAASITRTFTWNRGAMAIRVTALSGSRVAAGPYSITSSISHTNSALNSGLTSLGLPVTVTTTTPTVCQIQETGQVQSSGGIFTKATIKGLTNGTCTTVWSFAGNETRAPATMTYSYGITGNK